MGRKATVLGTWQCALCEASDAGTATRRARSDLSICDWCEAELARTERRRCRRCSESKPIASFSASKPRYCRACRQAMLAPYRATNRERAKARRDADPDVRERDRQRTAAWRAANRERDLAASQARYRRNRADRLAKQRERDARNRVWRLARLRATWPQRRLAHRLSRAQRYLRVLRGGA
jgi:hypothetical protein